MVASRRNLHDADVVLLKIHDFGRRPCFALVPVGCLSDSNLTLCIHPTRPHRARRVQEHRVPASDCSLSVDVRKVPDLMPPAVLRCASILPVAALSMVIILFRCSTEKHMPVLGQRNGEVPAALNVVDVAEALNERRSALVLLVLDPELSAAVLPSAIHVTVARQPKRGLGRRRTAYFANSNLVAREELVGRAADSFVVAAHAALALVIASKHHLLIAVADDRMGVSHVYALRLRIGMARPFRQCVALGLGTELTFLVVANDVDLK